MAKWKALKGSDGKYITAGFVELEAGAGQTVEEHDEPVKSIITELNTSNECPKKAAVNLLDPESLDADALKTVVEFLQAKYG